MAFGLVRLWFGSTRRHIWSEGRRRRGPTGRKLWTLHTALCLYGEIRYVAHSPLLNSRPLSKTPRSLWLGVLLKGLLLWDRTDLSPDGQTPYCTVVSCSRLLESTAYLCWMAVDVICVISIHRLTDPPLQLCLSLLCSLGHRGINAHWLTKDN